MAPDFSPATREERMFFMLLQEIKGLRADVQALRLSMLSSPPVAPAPAPTPGKGGKK